MSTENADVERDFNRAVLRLQRNDPTLRGVELFISTEGVRSLAESLRENSSLVQLNLGDNEIGVQGAVSMADMLQVNSSLTELYLGENIIGDQGVIVLANALQVNSSLTQLNLEHNNIGDQGMIALAGALQFNSSLTELRLASNNIGDQGVIILATALRVNTSLAVLDMEGNDIGDNGVMALAGALQVNSSVKELDVRGNNISGAGAAALVEMLQYNTSLERVFLPFQIELRGRVEELVEINREAASPHAAFGQKVKRIVDSEHGSSEDAVSLALAGVERFSESNQRREVLHNLLGSTEHGKDVAESLDLMTWRDFYRHAAECGAGPALANLLRARPSFSERRDNEQGGLYPFMLLAVMPSAGVGDVFDVLLMKPDLVASGIKMTSAPQRRKMADDTKA